jgi:hypothetical protein
MSENPSFWNKTKDEYTMNDSLKYVAVITTVALIAPYVLLGAVGGLVYVYDAGKKKIKSIKNSRTKD